MAPPAGELWCGGFHLGHPAATDSELKDERLQPVLAGLRAQRRLGACSTFVDLDGACAAARACRRPHAVHGVWFSTRTAAVLLRECADAPVAATLRLRLPGPPPAAVAAGFDVLGIGGEMCLPWTREDAGIELCRELSLPSDPPPFLPDPKVANRLVRALEDDALGAPVLWVRCWRTVHAAWP